MRGTYAAAIYHRYALTREELDRLPKDKHSNAFGGFDYCSRKYVCRGDKKALCLTAWRWAKPPLHSGIPMIEFWTSWTITVISFEFDYKTKAVPINNYRSEKNQVHFFFFLGPRGLDSLRTTTPLGKKS